MIDTEIRTLFEQALGDDMPTYPTQDEDVARGRRLRRRRRGRMAIAATAAGAAATALIMALPGTANHHTDVELHFTPSERTSDSAEGPPRLLVDDPAWTVQMVDERNLDTGTVGFVLADDPPRSWPAGTYDTTEITWRKAESSLEESLAQWTDDPDDKDKYNVMPATVSGADGAVIARPGQTHALLWHEDGYEMYVWTDIATLEEFERFVGQLREVGLETWESAMPEDYSPVYDNSEAVDAILASVPVIDHFDDLQLDRRLNQIDPGDEDALTEETIYLVACTWVRHWIHSDLDGEPPAIDDELTALVEWARADDAMTDDVVWDYVRSIIYGDADGQEMYDTAADDLRCGGW